GAELLRAGLTRIDYLEIRDAETLEPDPDPDRPTRIIGAAWMGDTRLIDNVPGGLSVDRGPDSI
ncbi:MAG: pantoate--beta-alanine ligase, partial [Alphaproteobacteria bacterium]|nr:pantoate--beta-alanine ligase [Alphaproteobacteria bacterium]